ncbi:MAG: helix-turn-helix transcriptional regulator, partial [Candidatus Binataceae bacterium]
MAHPHDQLRRVRAALGLSQNDLARRAGISRQALGAIEAGQYQPGVSVAIALARELGATVEALFGVESPGQVAAAVPVSVKLAAGSHVTLA